MQPFDLLNAPLEGINLIEASAGTGKTYNIEGLYVRLILEMQLQVDQILVLTFTNAATEELKDRIRKKLVRTKSAFARGNSDDQLIAALVRKSADAKAAEMRLHDALVDFDQAAIYTIHGFCQRVLHEYAFETGTLFDTELVTDQTRLAQEVVDDFWRRSFYDAAPELISFAMNRNYGPDYFLRLLTGLATPNVKIVPVLAEPDLQALPAFRSALETLKLAWPARRQSVMQALADPALKANIYGSTKADPKQPGLSQRDLRNSLLVEAMDNLADPMSVGFPLFENFVRFTTAKIINSTKKNIVPPTHDFFDICEDLYDLGTRLSAEMASYLVYLKGHFLEVAAGDLKKKKREQNVQYFEDLLTTLLDALRSEQGHVLQAAVRRQYKAALVDEFQDTDHTQYRILTRLFSQKSSLLFMIGDPKQAIYSFRGADIFSYMQAARRAEAKFTLIRNWRSKPGLITAVNTLFENCKAPFVFDEIPFAAGESAGPPADPVQSPDPPFTLWYLSAARFAENQKLINKTDALQLIADAVGAEIGRLTGGAVAAAPGDIAVLVRTNDQAQLMKSTLNGRNIPSILYSTGNIFDTREAAEMELVLKAISDPFELARLKAALSTDMLGMAAEELISESRESQLWDRRLARFGEYHELWSRYGFIRMFRRLLSRERIRERLLSLPDGERQLTNVLHLSEVLHRRSMDHSAGISDLLKWLAEQRDPATPRLEEHQLRLESDEKAVKIVTIHKCKGLEYPIVFCPFAWEKSLTRNEEFTFHDIDDGGRLTLELGSEASTRHRVLAQNEILSENLRLLYVALTRARDRCYLAWGRINTAETSALAYLLHAGVERPSGFPSEDLSLQTGNIFKAKTDAEFVADLQHIAAKSQNSIRVEPLPPAAGSDDRTLHAEENEPPRFARIFGGKIDRSWKISSYSSLIASGSPDVDLPDRDVARNFFEPAKLSPAEVSIAESGRPAASIFSFPKGARAGTFFHDILEHYDFTVTEDGVLEQLAAAKLQQYGFDPAWLETVCRTLNKVLSVALLPDLAGLKLSSIPMDQRINEMEFYFPLNYLTPGNLFNVFKQVSLPRDLKTFSGNLEKLDFRPRQGFMKGYIDLIFRDEGRFYLVDWKSNFLGAEQSDYDPSSLMHAMHTELYTLQYHLYTLALHQYLRSRQPGYHYEDNFGGVLYVFIRGVEPRFGPGTGIFFDRPSEDLIHHLGRALIPGYGNGE